MKNIKTVVIILLLILSIVSGCAGNEIVTEAGIVDEIPAFSATPMPLPLPIKTDLNTDPMNVVDTFVCDRNVCFTEDSSGMLANEFSSFVMNNMEISEIEDGVAFTSAGTNAYLETLEYFDTYSLTGDYANQGILFKIMLIDCDNIMFGLPGSGGENKYDDLKLYQGKYPITWDLLVRRATGGIKIERNTWYYFFMTKDDFSNQRYVIWEKGKAEDLAYYSYRSILGESDQAHVEDQLNQRMKFRISISNGEQFVLANYWIIEYSELVK